MDYTLKLESANGDVKQVTFSKKLAIYGISILTIFILIFAASLVYASYSFLWVKSQAAEIEELKSVNKIQQEQILNISKKAVALEKKTAELQTVESELRVLSGIASKADEAATNEKNQAKTDENGEPKKEGEGGSFGEGLEHLEAYLNHKEHFLAESETRLTDLRGAIQEKIPRLGAFKMTNYASGATSYGAPISVPSLWPSSGVVTSPYGYRWGGTDFHPGIDIADDMGTPIVATADGVVDYAGWNAYGYGNMVDIVHDSGIVTRYAHAMSVVVVPGQRVRAGQLIAYMGSTGFSTGPHVHYEVRIGNQAINPSAYLH